MVERKNMYELIERINEATDVKKFKVDELDKLAAEIREALFNRLTKIGGHFGPNFGIVEAEIALHYVFNSPTDQFVFDVTFVVINALNENGNIL